MDSDDDQIREKRAREADAAALDDSDLGSDVDDGYGPDLYGDAEDRARLAAMTEFERERILADRADARDKVLEQRRAVRLAAGVKAPKQPRAATAARAAKQPEAALRRAAVADLVQARRAGAARAADREAARRSDSAEPGEGDYTTRRAARRAGAGADDDDGDGYETGEDARPSSAAAVAARAARRRAGGDSEGEEGGGDDDDDEPATHAEAVCAQVRRAQLARWLGEPHAGRTLPGTLIRLSFNNAYMAAEVVELVERPAGTYRDAGRPVPTPYTLVAGGVPAPPVPGAAAPAKAIKTSTWLKVARGGSLRLFPATLVSNAPLSEDEFESWQRQLARDGLRPWPRRAARAAAAQIADAAAYTYTAADVAALVEAKRAAGGGRVVNRAVERTRLSQHLAAALQAGDAARAAALEQQLAALDAAAEAERKARSAASARSMDEVNRRNAERNLAISLKGAGPGGGGGGALGAEGDDGEGGAPAADPFKRRETRPRHMWATGRTKAATGEGGDDAPGAPAPAPPPAAVDAGPRAEDVDARELYAAVLGLDLSALSAVGSASAAPTTAAELARQLLGEAWAPPVRVSGGGGGGGQRLTLAQYFERRQGVGQ